MKKKSEHFKTHDDPEHGHDRDDKDEYESRLELNEELVRELDVHQIESEAFPVGAHIFERGHFYSHNFSLTPRVTTNRGIIRLKGKNVDYLQIIQRI